MSILPQMTSPIQSPHSSPPGLSWSKDRHRSSLGPDSLKRRNYIVWLARRFSSLPLDMKKEAWCSNLHTATRRTSYMGDHRSESSWAPDDIVELLNCWNIRPALPLFFLLCKIINVLIVEAISVWDFVTLNMQLKVSTEVRQTFNIQPHLARVFCKSLELY